MAIYSTSTSTADFKHTDPTYTTCTTGTATFEFDKSNIDKLYAAIGIDTGTGGDSIGLSLYNDNNLKFFTSSSGYTPLEITSTGTGIGLHSNTNYPFILNPPYATINILNPPYGYATINSEGYFEQNKRQRLKSNLIISRKSRADIIPNNIPDNERVAIETLREVISETEFRKYLKYGFVLVKGQSGKTYQIFRNKSHTKVWLGGQLVEEICVRISYAFNTPPTDNVIALKTMIETDEEECRSLANVYKMKQAA